MLIDDWCAECNTDASQCSIPIRDRLSTMPDTPHYAAYRAWAVGDTKLDWQGAEPGQGTFNGQNAGGSPTAWTTNDQNNNAAYHALNRSAYVHAFHTFCA